MTYEETNRKLLEAMDEYNKRFEEPIGLLITDAPDPDKFIEDIRRCIETGVPYKYPKVPDDALI